MTGRELSRKKLCNLKVIERLTSLPVFVTSACMLFISPDRLSVTVNGALGTPGSGVATAVANKAARREA